MLVAALAVLAAALSVPTRAQPSGVPVADALLRAMFAAGVVWFAAAGRRWTWFVLAGGAGLLGGGAAFTSLAVVALGLAYAAAFAPRRVRLVGGLVAFISVQILLRLPYRFPAVLTAMVVAVCCVPCVVSGYKLHSRRARKRIRVVSEALVVAGFVFALVFGLTVLQARTSVDRGVAEARSALAQARLGNQQEAVRRFEVASVLIGKAEADLDAWWARPARTLPFVGLQSNAISDSVHGVGVLVRQSTSTARVADYRRLRAAKGQIDLPLLESYQAPVAGLTRRLEQTHRDLDRRMSPWLLPPLRHQIEGFDLEVTRSAREARSASEVLNVAPQLLGARGPRRYALLFSTPSEARELGGFTGNFGELTAVNGKLTLERTVRSSDLQPATPAELDRRTLPGDDALPTRYRYYQPARYPGNVTGTQDFPTVARTFNALYPETGGPPVDGVIYVDPYGLAGLLKLTGPVAVEGLDQPLTSDNAAEFLLKQQYTIFSDFSNRVDYLDNASRNTFEQLTGRELPGPRTIADALSPLVRRHRLLAYSFHPEDRALLDRVGLSGAVPPTDGDDYLSMTTANANPNKIDAYLERSINYDAHYDPKTGSVSSTATVTLHNTSPTSGLPDYTISNEAGLPYGTNHTFLSVYSPLELQSATADGRPVDTEPQIEYGRNRYGLFVDVPPGGTTTLTFQLSGRLAAASTYRLRYLAQPVVNPDRLAFTVEPAGGVKVAQPRLTGPAIGLNKTSSAQSAKVEAFISGGTIEAQFPLLGAR